MTTGARIEIARAQQKAKPVSDRAEKAVGYFAAWTPQEEQEIGEATAAKMFAMFGAIETPPLVRYVDRVGQSVAQYAPAADSLSIRQFWIPISSAPSALPGGFIFITKTALEA